MTAATDAHTDAANPEPRNGGWRPVPDPTSQTTEQLLRAVAAERDRVDGQLDTLRERLAGIDRATELRMGGIEGIPDQIDEKVGNLKAVSDEKFASIQTQFAERDTRSEREARDNTKAVDAAFAAQKESASEQNKSNTLAIDKSERATAETIKTNQELNKATTDALTKSLDEVKLAISRIESLKVGATESRTGLYAGLGAIATLIFVGMAVVAFIASH